VRFLTDTSGNVIDTYNYDAFGNLIQSTGTTPNDYRYSGEQLDGNTGFYYLRARYFNQSSGRFVTMDGFEGDNGEPITLHKYLYAGNNAVNFDDPSGNCISCTLAFVTSEIISNLFSGSQSVVKNPLTKSGRLIVDPGVPRGYPVESRTFGNLYNVIDCSLYKSVTNPECRHKGIDLKGNGMPVRATHSGKVYRSQPNGGGGGYGEYIIIVGDGEKYATLYAHLAIRTATVLGEHVKYNQEIGISGATGNASGPHLHYEVRLPKDLDWNNGNAKWLDWNDVDPNPYLSGLIRR